MGNNQYNFSKSFTDWCNENNEIDLLKRWDYELNKQSPSTVGCSSNKYWWFKCDKHPEHHSELKKLNSITSGKGFHGCNQCNSFGQWCIDNNHVDTLNKWDYELNIKSPFDISYMSHEKCYFKCPIGIHKSSQTTIYSIVSNSDGTVHCIGCESFGQWAYNNFGPDFFNTYWSVENKIDPYEIPMRSNKIKIVINCLEKEYHGSYITHPDTFVHGCRCPYCGHSKLHIYDSLGYKYPHVIDIWSDQNTKSPYLYTINSDQYVWWKCNDGKHKEYRRRVADSVKYEFRCPECVKTSTNSALEQKVSEYILSNYDFELKHEHQCSIRPINQKTKMPMPYDNEIVELKLIIEVNGKQHYDYHFYKTFYKLEDKEAYDKLQQRKDYDEYKMNYAISNGFNYLIIPYWAEKNDEYKQLIDNKINELLSIKNQ